MKNSEKFLKKLKLVIVSHIITALLIIGFLTKIVLIDLLPYIEKKYVIYSYIILVIFILIILYEIITTRYNYSMTEKRMICEELDNKLDKEFPRYGLYITENYIVHTSKPYDIYNVVAVPIEKIDGIYIGKVIIRSGKPRKYSLILTSGTKIYYVITTDPLYKEKVARIDEMGNYLLERCFNAERLSYPRIHRTKNRQNSF